MIRNKGQVVRFAAFFFFSGLDRFPLTCRVSTCAPCLAHLWESRWWGHLRACLHARDESCSGQGGRTLFVDSFPSGLWIRPAVHGEPGLAGKDCWSQLLDEGPGAVKLQQRNCLAFQLQIQRGVPPSSRYPGLWLCTTPAWTSGYLIVNRIVYSLIQIIRLEYTWINTSSSGGWALTPRSLIIKINRAIEMSSSFVMYKCKMSHTGWCFVIHTGVWWIDDTFSIAI